MTLTLIEKNCGHLGYTKEQYVQDRISCTQCSLATKDLENIRVPITRRRHVDTDIPELTQEELDHWIKQQLEEL